MTLDQSTDIRHTVLIHSEFREIGASSHPDTPTSRKSSR